MPAKCIALQFEESTYRYVYVYCTSADWVCFVIVSLTTLKYIVLFGNCVCGFAYQTFLTTQNKS